MMKLNIFILSAFLYSSPSLADEENCFHWAERVKSASEVLSKLEKKESAKGKHLIEEYEREMHKECIKEASEGAPAAQYIVGMNFDEGIGTEKNILQAFYWWVRSSNSGYTGADVNIANLILEGKIQGSMLDVYYWYLRAYRDGASMNVDLCKIFDSHITQTDSKKLVQLVKQELNLKGNLQGCFSQQ